MSSFESETLDSCKKELDIQAAAAAAAAAAASSSQPSGLALPSGPSLALPGSNGLALPSGAAPVQPLKQPQPFSHQQSNAVAGPSSPPSSSAVPSTPAPLSLEQQHITAVEGIVPTLQNIVATVISIADSTSRQLPCTPAMPNTTLRYVYSKLTLSLSESCAYIHVRFFPSAFPSRHHAYS